MKPSLSWLIFTVTFTFLFWLTISTSAKSVQSDATYNDDDISSPAVVVKKKCKCRKGYVVEEEEEVTTKKPTSYEQIRNVSGSVYEDNGGDDAGYEDSLYSTTKSAKKLRKTSAAADYAGENDGTYDDTATYKPKSTSKPVFVYTRKPTQKYKIPAEYDDGYGTTDDSTDDTINDDYEEYATTKVPKKTKKMTTESYADTDQEEYTTTKRAKKTQKYASTTPAYGDVEYQDYTTTKAPVKTTAYAAANDDYGRVYTTKANAKKSTTAYDAGGDYEDEIYTSKVTKKPRKTTTTYYDGHVEDYTTQAPQKKTTTYYEATSDAYVDDYTTQAYATTRKAIRTTKKSLHYEDDDADDEDYATTKAPYTNKPNVVYEKVTSNESYKNGTNYAYLDSAVVKKGKVITVQQNATRETDIVIRLIKKGAN